MSRPQHFVPVERPSRGRHVSLLAVLLLLSLGYAALGQDGQVAVAQRIRSTVLYPFISLHRGFAEQAVTRRTVRALAAERDSLAAALTTTRRVAADVGQLRRLLALEVLETGGFFLADLVPGRPHIGRSEAFVVTLGRESGVNPPVGVMAGEGVVGIVRSASGTTASGHFWTHPEFRVSVRTEDGGSVGIVRPLRDDDGRMLMELEGTPYQEEVPVGSVLVTSGVAGLYPAGIPVGIVRAISEVHTGWARSYLVEPAVRPDAVSVVLVWRRPGSPE